MPSLPAPWGHFINALALEVALLVLLAFVAHRCVRGAAWRRTMWRIALVGMAVVAVVEVSGVKQGPVFKNAGRSQTRASTAIVFETKADAQPGLAAFVEGLKRQRGDSAQSSVGGTEPGLAMAWWPGWIWLAGCVAVGAWMGFGRLAFAFFIRRRVLRDEAIIQRADALSRRLGLRRRIALSVTPGLAGPIAFGILRPGISVPEDFSESSSTRQDVMLAHELAHLAARDPWWHAFADVLAAMLWWHPLVWAARRQMRASSEAAADEASLLIENGPIALAECLVELGERLAGTRTRSLGWLGIEGGGVQSGLGRRVKELVRMPGRTWKSGGSARSRVATSAGAVALVLTVLAATSWMMPREARADTVHQALKESVLGIVFAAAMPGPQADAPAVSPEAESSVALHTRWFRIDPGGFSRALHGLLGTNSVSSKASDGDDAMLADLRRVLSAAGVELIPPKQMLLNQGTGVLMVRATLQELETIESAVQALSTGPPQVMLEVRLCEFSAEAGREMVQDPVLGAGVLGSTSAAILSASAATNGTEKTTQAILTAKQFGAVLGALEGRAGVDVLTTPKVTTLSGRQAQIKVVNVRYVVTDLDLDVNRTQRDVSGAAATANQKPIVAGGAGHDESASIQPVAEPFELGPVIDLVPYVESDGLTISLTVIASIREFLGYENIEGLLAAVKVGQASPRTQVVPLPNFRLRQVMTSARVLDGQTLVLVGGTTDASPSVGLRSGGATTVPNEPAGSTKKSLLVFVTPTLIDPAGNRISNQ